MQSSILKKTVGLEKLKNHELNIQRYESLLMEQARYLKPHAEEIAKQWSALYLETFGRGSFFSPERVQKVHKDMVAMFIDYLDNGKLEVYLEKLSSKGSLFASLGVPFEEIIISVHLFEESCLPILLKYYTDQSKLYPTLVALEELYHSGLVVLASSYFFNIKKHLEYNTILMEEENKKLKDNLSRLTNSYFLYTKKELGSIRLLISAINSRLREKVTHLNEINTLSKLLRNEYDMSKVITLALNKFLQTYSRKAIIIFALSTENGEKFLLFSNNPFSTNLDNIIVEVREEVKSADIPEEFVETIFNKNKLVIRMLPEQIPVLLCAKIPNLKLSKNFLIFPVKNHTKPIGFLMTGNLSDYTFTKDDTKFYLELSEFIIFSIQRTMLFNNLKNHVDFLRQLDKLNISLLKGDSITNILEVGIDTILNVLSVDRCSIMLLDKDTQHLRVFLAKGPNTNPIGNLCLKIGEGIAGRVAENREPMQIAAVRSDHHFLPQKETGLNFSHIKSLLCVPLKSESSIFGVINIASISKYRTFSKDELDIIHDISERICIALNKATKAVS